jgi:hypothetical protein
VVAGRIRQELATLERVVTRVERAAHTLEQLPEYQAQWHRDLLHQMQWKV